MWIIYKHTNKINGKSYIGQTCQSPEERWRDGEGYKHSPKFYHAIQKYGWNNFEHSILVDNIQTRELADEKEKELIKYYDTINNGYNIHQGGTGFTSEEAKKYNQKNWKDGTFNKIWCKKVICVNTQKIYDSLKQASEETGVHKDGISNCCRHITKSAGTDKDGNRLVWEFYEEGKVYKYKKPLHKKSKKVICLTTNEIFDTIQEASNKYNICHSCISNCCTGKRKTAGQLKDGTRLQWKYYNENGEIKIENERGKAN